eukprot:363865-Chlamydomonas_euryale.AAC.19
MQRCEHLSAWCTQRCWGHARIWAWCGHDCGVCSLCDCMRMRMYTCRHVYILNKWLKLLPGEDRLKPYHMGVRSLGMGVRDRAEGLRPVHASDTMQAHRVSEPNILTISVRANTCAHFITRPSICPFIWCPSMHQSD